MLSVHVRVAMQVYDLMQKLMTITVQNQASHIRDIARHLVSLSFICI